MIVIGRLRMIFIHDLDDKKQRVQHVYASVMLTNATMKGARAHAGLVTSSGALWGAVWAESHACAALRC